MRPQNSEARLVLKPAGFCILEAYFEGFFPSIKKGPGEGKTMARPSFEPTDQQRARVAQLVSFGLTQRELCALVQGEEGKPISEKTLRKHFAEELAYGSCQ